MSTRRTPRSTSSPEPGGRRRQGLASAVVVLITLGAAAVLVHADHHRSGSAARATRTTAAPTTSTTLPRAASPVLRSLAVTTTGQDLVDTTRPVTGAGGTLAAVRALPTTLWSPVGPGPYPLVVFVHGFDRGPGDYARFATALASAGYVVAGPSFPQEDPARGFPLDRSHLVDEAGDVSFVVRSLQQQAGALHLAPGRVAVVGHSDGADVALLSAYGPGTADPAVGAVVADAPDPMTAAPVTSAAPLLLVQGTADPVVPYAASTEVFAAVRAPVAYLSLVGADHLGPIAGGTPWTPLLDDAVARFLDAAVAHRGPQADPLAAVAATPPLTTLQTRP